MNAPVRYRPRIPLRDSVEAQVLKLAGPSCKLCSHEDHPWASITFKGSRHKLVLSFEGEDGVSEGGEFVSLLPDHEFRIPAHLVADSSVRDIDHRFGESERMFVTCVILVLEDVR